MKTCQSTGYFQQAPVILLLCLFSSFVFAASAFALTGNAIDQCYDCHGSSGDIRPVDATYRNISTGAFVGNHRQHLPVATTNTNVCTPCHGAAPTSMSHRNGQIAIRQHINSTASIRGTYSKPLFFNQTSAPNLTSAYCSNVNCHFRTQTPNWGTAPLAGGQTVTNCAFCHKSVAMSTGNHAKHITSLDTSGGTTVAVCTTCHPNNSTFTHSTSAKTGGIINITFAGAPTGAGTYTGTGTHMNYPNYLDGTGTYNSCNNTYCHGPSGPTWNGGAMACSNCHTVTTVGGHAIHAPAFTARFNVMSGNVSSGTTARFTCSACHNPNLASHSRGEAVAGVRAAEVFYMFTAAGKGSLATYANGVAGGTDGSLKWTAATAAVCNSTYCHSNGQSGAGYAAGTGSVSWVTTTRSNGVQPACTGCHGDGTTGNTLSGKHPNHLNTTVNTNLVNPVGCVECHAKTVTNNTTIVDKSKHVNKYRDYSGAKAYRSTYTAGNCTTYCHSNGNPGAAGDQKTVNWTTGTAITACTGCHGSQATGPNGVFTSQFGEPNYVNFSSVARDSFNAHTSKHIKAITDCYTCHNTTVQASGALAVAGTHIDKTRNVSFNTAVAGASASYNSLTQRCSNVVCHNGTTVRWGQTVDCNSCHPLASLSGAHARHTGYFIANRPLSVYANLTANKSTGSDTDGSGGAQWAKYGFACSVCHPLSNAAHGNGTVQIALYEAGTAATVGTMKSKTLVAAAYTGTIGTGNVRCQNVYCHSNGKGVFGNTSTWRYAYKPSDRCSMCHGNAPTGTAHDAHVASLHNDDIYKGYSSGKMPAAGAVGVRAGHGDPAQSTTISCYLCHNGTTTVARNKYNAACSNASCHGNATGQNADATGAIYITSLSSHVNGAVEVKFANVVVKSKAQLRDASFVGYTGGVNGWKRNGTYKKGTTAYDYAKNPLTSGTFSSGTCSNIACHPGPNVNWTTNYGQAVNCVICHNTL